MSAEPEIIVAVEGKITDAKLDESKQRMLSHEYNFSKSFADVEYILEALRACRKEVKAKDACIATLLPLLREVYEGYLRSTPESLKFEWVDWGERVEAALARPEHAGRFPMSMSVTERWEAMWDAHKSGK